MLDKELPKQRIIKRVSVDLRQMAVNRGAIIDDVFRNRNGISYQIRSMESAFTGHRIHVPATKLFIETVNMYRNDRQQYEKVLKEAKSMIMPVPCNKKMFMAWSTEVASKPSNKWVEDNLKKIETYGNKTGIISGSIFDITDEDVLERLFRSVSKSKVFQITNRKIYKHLLQDLQTYRYFCKNKTSILSEMQEKIDEKVTDTAVTVPIFLSAVPAKQESVAATSELFHVDFDEIGDLSFTQPNLLVFNGKSHTYKKWKQLYVSLLKELYRLHRDKFNAEKDNATLHSNALMMCNTQKVDTFRKGEEIADGLYVETNYSATTIVNNIRSFLDLCNVSYNDVAITYTKRNKSPCHSIPQENIQLEKSMAKYSQGLLDAAETIIATSFVNGMRKNAIIAKKKFRNAYLKLTGDELPEDIDIDDLVSYVGVEYSDKIYAISEEDKLHIKEFVHAAMDAGNRVMFYEEIYRLNMAFMTSAGIFSSDLLKIVLKQIMPEMRYKRTSFSLCDSDSLEQDIIACYEDKLMLTYGEIKNRLPYADMCQIRFVCSRSNKLVWAKEETYALSEKLQLSPADIKESKRIISYDIKEQGFSVFQRITALESTELNPSVPEVALKEAIYALHLSADYERNRSIITLPEASFTPSSVMVEYCKGLKEATLSQLQSYEEDLTNKTSYSLGVAYSYMIRVEKERFVSLDSLSFDVQAIDNALSLFVRDEIIPLKSVNSFTSFPEIIGYTWNLFMLDSYCQHFSIRFRSMGGPAKSKPVGAIFPSQMQFGSYDDLLAQVAAKSDLKLNADDVSKFFKNNAYTLRRIDTNGIIAKAQEMRIQED
ncbi:hypothetical protein [Caproicibacter sp. BJN0012]|uniref:hypothetical protein n=1 Tax=Caproicibacter sp. BJN0012 TaxID=3110227 RepID=UPI002E0F74FD